MPAGRTLVAGLAGGIAMFAWASIAHIVLPVSGAGIQEIAKNEPALLELMHATLGESSGFYLYPGMGVKAGAGAAERNAAMQGYDQKLAVNPSGLIIYHPPGEKALTAGQMVSEFLTELLEALLAVFLLSQTRLSTIGARAGFVALAGVLAAMPTNLSYAIWYGFPGSYTAAYMAIQIAGFGVAGIAAALVLRSGAGSRQVTMGGPEGPPPDDTGSKPRG